MRKIGLTFFRSGAPTVGLSIWKWTEYMKGIKRQLLTTSQVISLRSLWTMEILIFWHQRKTSLKIIWVYRQSANHEKYRGMVDSLGTAELWEALGSINPTKSTGCDNIPSRILKIASKTLARPSLTNLYNKCISYGSWPQQWKRGKWVPTFKKDAL